MENEFDWKQKLTPFDAELALMVESLTGKPCELKNGGNCYFFTVNYIDHANDPDYLAAICQAIEGRTGERLLEISDDTDQCQFMVHVKFSDTKYPGIVRLPRNHAREPTFGYTYCRKLKEIQAGQVTRGNVERLLHFVGNGEMEIERCPGGKATFHFRNAAGSVYAHAPEYSYIVYVSPGRFEIVDQETFEKEYELR